MRIQNHRLVDVPFIESPNRSGFMTPTGDVMHFTASSTARSAISTLTNRRSRASAHVVIDFDGSITQLVPFNRIAWHAGPSRMAGRDGANLFTIGFEFVNPGFYQIRNGQYFDWTGERKIGRDELARWDPSHHERNARVGGGIYAWPAYHEAQIEAGLALLEELRDAYGIVHLAGHDEIDKRGWKTDPGPMFPWSRFRKVMEGGAFENTDQTRLDLGTGEMKVRAGRLNVRQGPGTHFRVLTAINLGTRVTVLKDTGAWSRISFDGGRIGWVADEYLEAA